MKIDILSNRFRGFMPVVIDIETAGFDARKDALLEIGVVTLTVIDGMLKPKDSLHAHIEPFPGLALNEENLKFNKIDPFHPFRMAKSEREALSDIFRAIRKHQKEHNCNRSVLVGHNSWFDLSFINAAVARNAIKRCPLHPFTSFDTATLAALVFGQTVLSSALNAANIEYDPKQSHGALYDATITAELFCKIVNDYSLAHENN